MTKRVLLWSAAICAAAFCVYYFGAPGRVMVGGWVDHIGYDTLDEMVQYADLIVIGEAPRPIQSYAPIAELGEDGNPNGIRYTLIDVSVDKVLKGSPASVVKMSLLAFRTGFKYHKDLWVADGLSPLQVGKPYLLFLKQGLGGQYYVVGVHLGKISLDGTDQMEVLMAKAEGDRYLALRLEALDRYREVLR